MIDFLKKYKKEIIRVVIAIVSMILLALIILGILMLTKVITFEDGFKFNISIFDNLRDSFWIYVVFILLQVVITTLLCFAPGTTTMFIGLGIALFGANWKCFLTLYIGVVLSSIAMDLVGRFGGSFLIKKLIGENNYLEATNLLKEKGTVYLPFMYLLPIFPDDALCMVAGMIKLKFPLHLIYICLCRGIGIATIVFGFSVIPFSEFDGVYDYLVLIAVILVYVFVLFKITRWLDKMYSKYLKRKQEKELTKQNDDSNEIKEIESSENKE